MLLRYHLNLEIYIPINWVMYIIVKAIFDFLLHELSRRHSGISIRPARSSSKTNNISIISINFHLHRYRMPLAIFYVKASYSRNLGLGRLWILLGLISLVGIKV